MRLVNLSLVLTLSLSCSGFPGNGGRGQTGGNGVNGNDTDKDEKALPEAIADFTQAFYGHMASKNVGKNFAFSPLSLHSALTMLYLGATKNSVTETELRDSLYGLNTRDTLKQEYKKLIDFYQKQPSFKYGNRIWTKKGFTIKQDYINNVLKNLGADAETTDFSSEAVDNVNKWVSNLTNGTITDLVSTFSPDTRMFLANALYFKEDWQVDFSEKDIQSGKALNRESFYVVDQDNRVEEVEVPMMEQIATSDTYKYGVIELEESSTAKVVTIPYKNDHFEMQIIIPGSNLSNSLAILEDQMRRGTEKLAQEEFTKKKPQNPFNLFSFPKNIYSRLIDDIGIKMPMFKISKKVDVANILQDMKINQVFEGAEMEQMTDDGQLTVSSVIHKAVIDVDKKGTTAAAATGIELVLLSASFGERVRLDVNQPFIFIIQDKTNRIPVMVGRVMDPRQQ